MRGSKRTDMMQLQKKEKWIGLFSLCALTFFLALSCLVHSTVENLDDEDLLTKTEKVTVKTGVLNKARGVLRSATKMTSGSSLTLRQRFLEKHGYLTEQEIIESLSKQRKPHPGLPDDISYDIFNCPETPPSSGYPFAWNALQVLKHWNTDKTTIPDDFIHQGLCVFDWRNEKQREIAERYREAELPFVLSNHPEVNAVAYRWSTPGYVQDLVGDTPQRNEYSHNNHFMYWKRRKNAPQGWTNPTENIELSFAKWLQHAEQVEKMSDSEQVESDHWYFRLNADFNKDNMYVYDELPFFRPSMKPTTFMVDSSQQRGINCRFGMKGVIAESHFDSSRNWIVLLSGQRRYILAHPDQCINMEMYPKNHPSGRHSSIDWSSVDESHEGPFSNARVNEVVLQAGDALYLPTFWLHFIVSLNINYQCNARSGVTHEYYSHIQQCGFQ